MRIKSKFDKVQAQVWQNLCACSKQGDALFTNGCASLIQGQCKYKHNLDGNVDAALGVPYASIDMDVQAKSTESTTTAMISLAARASVQQ
eukprot:390735-Pelagomonas_calceolata.AAC.2